MSSEPITKVVKNRIERSMPRNQGKVWALLLFLFPVGAFISALRNFRIPQSRNIFWFSCIFFGLTYIYNPISESRADGIRYAEDLIVIHDNPQSWETFKASFYDSSGGFLDLYQPIVTFSLAFFTGEPRILFAVFALVFGFFYSRNMWFVLGKIPMRLNFTLIVLITTLFLVNPIWNINGVRMWTAAQVFVYGALPYIWSKDKSKILWVFASLLIHFSFFIPVLILLAYIALPKKSTLPFLVLYLVSLFISEIEISFFQSLAEYLPDILDRKVAGYTSETYVAKVFGEAETAGLFVTLLSYISKWGVAVLLIYITVKEKRVLKLNSSLRNLLTFSMFILAISFFLSNVPSGGRFVTVASVFVFAFLVLYYAFLKQTNLNISGVRLIEFVAVFFAFALFLPLRTPTVFYGLTVFTNPIVAFFTENRESIYNLIKSL